MKMALVTGANGFIGSHLVEALCLRNIHVRCLVRKTSNLQWIRHLDIELIQADFNDPESLVKSVQNIDVIFHLAGATKAFDEKSFQLSNITATQNLLAAALSDQPHLKRFLFVSTQAAAGPSRNKTPVKETDETHPLTLYGKSKRAAEFAVLSCADRLPVTIVRSPSVFGPRDRDMLQIFRAVKFGIQPVLGLKSHYASLVYVDDLVNGLIQAAVSSESIGETYFMATESCMDWKYFSRTVAEIMQKQTIRIFIPLWAFASIALISEGVSRITRKPHILNLDKIKDFRERFWICDSSKAEKDFNFHKSIEFKEAVDATYKWYLQQGWL